jgi:hypothetical protein
MNNEEYIKELNNEISKLKEKLLLTENELNKTKHKLNTCIAIIDVIMTIIGAFLLSRLFRWNFVYTLISLFLLGIILHRLFCVKTTIDKLLFPNAK